MADNFRILGTLRGRRIDKKTVLAGERFKELLIFLFWWTNDAFGLLVWVSLLAWRPLVILAVLIFPVAVITGPAHFTGFILAVPRVAVFGLVLSLIPRLLFFLVAVPFQGAKADLANQLNKLWFSFLLGCRMHFGSLQLFNLDPFLVHGFDLFYRFDRKRVLNVAVWQHIPHQVAEDVFLNQNGIAFHGFKYVRMVREML